MGQVLYKYRRLLLAISLVLAIILLFLDWQMRKIGNVLLVHTYTSYISQEYMPAQRRLTRKWPANLSQMTQHIKAEKDYSRVNERLNNVLQFHRDAFTRLEPIRSDRERYTYRLHLKGYVARCTSVVNKSGFDEGNCTYEQE